MTDLDYIEIFEIDTDAVAVNRGFYYQYLKTLKNWLTNFINKENTFIYCEVDDDIKEVGNKLIFTQIKSYTKNFSLNSEEIKKTLYNFFILYLKNKDNYTLEFCFSTNTSVAKSEKLLQSWIANPELSDSIFADKVLNKIKKIINSEINKHKRNKLEKGNIEKNKKDIINRSAELLKTHLAELNTNNFIKNIKWEFLELDPDLAIDTMFQEIRYLLSHEIFGNKPISIIESILLSEIYRCSQIKDKTQRVLTNSRIEDILFETENDISRYIDTRLIALFNLKLEIIEQSIKTLQKNQYSFNKRLDSIEEKIDLKTENRVYPKYLTIKPRILEDEIYDRQNLINRIKIQLDEAKCLSLHGSGGIGKTLIIQHLLKQSNNDYKHIAWINSSPTIIKSMLLNVSLIKNLDIDLEDAIIEEGKMELICNKLNQIDGKNLLVIDNFESDLTDLYKIINIENWQIIITSRQRIPSILNIEIPNINKESALKLFLKYNKMEAEIDDSLLEEFLLFINYNPLVIKLCGQLITNSIDLRLETLFTFIKDQKLDNENIAFNVHINNEESPSTILNYLLKVFELKNLTRDEEHYLGFLAILPYEEIKIKELALICGKELYESNLVEITNLVNSLHNKGWIERVGGEIRMHRLVQEIIIYKIRKEKNAFTSNLFFIIWLYHRIDEVALNDPTKSFPFLKYAESILNAIKEEYRRHIYQPLLLLENSLLNAYNWIYNPRTLNYRWVNLIQRAEIHLPNNDRSLGIMFNNLGLSYASSNKLDEAIVYFEKSISTLLRKEDESIDLIINSLNNLNQVYFLINDMPSAHKTQLKIWKLIRKYPSINKQFVASSIFLKATYLMKSLDYKGALEEINLAIEKHLEIEKGSRNDLHLLEYYSNKTQILFKLKKDEMLMENIKTINQLIEDNIISYSSTLKEIKNMNDSILDYIEQSK